MTNPTQLRSGPDIDWRSKCVPGDDQGQTNACSVFAIASWVEAVTGRSLSDAETIAAWRAERRRRYNDTEGGLTQPEAFYAAHSAGWLPPGTQLRRVYDLSTLTITPLIASYSVAAGWYNARPDGELDLSQPTIVGKHDVLLVSNIGRDIWIENSWGPTWGLNGFGRMIDTFHLQYCAYLWQILLPGKPTTEAEADAAEARVLASMIGDSVRSIHRNLLTLGYDLPCDPSFVMADIIRRSESNQLNADQERAKSNLADVWLMLKAEGITAAHVIAVWNVIKPPTQESI